MGWMLTRFQLVTKSMGSKAILFLSESVRSFVGRAVFVVLSILFIGSSSLLAAEKIYEKPTEFLKRNFGGIPKTQAITLDEQQFKELKKILGSRETPKKIRYWKSENKIAWVLNKKGKSEPITTGFIVREGQISELKVLIYRESHGWEVSRPFFTKQFTGASLDGKKLSTKVDGVVGATLSVNALKKLAAAALYLSQQVEK